MKTRNLLPVAILAGLSGSLAAQTITDNSGSGSVNQCEPASNPPKSVNKV